MNFTVKVILRDLKINFICSASHIPNPDGYEDVESQYAFLLKTPW